MASWASKKRKPDQDQDQKQDQKQDQDQDQKQDQAQGQWQFALSENKNDNDNKNDNKNDNDNKNENKNENENTVDNKLDNKVDNDLKNDVDNKIENTVENKIENNVEVNVKVDLDLDLDLARLAGHDNNSDHGIHIDELKDIDSSVIFTQTVDQELNGNGNQFNVQQINNLVDNDHLSHPEVKFEGAGWGGDFKIDVKVEGGDVKIDDAANSVGNDGHISAPVSADAINTVSAFTQNIVMGANIQFNSMTTNAAGHDLQDNDHTL
jgi:hypothetical protein